MSRENFSKVPRLLYSSIMKNIFLPDFIIFARYIFHNFEHFLGSFSTPWPPNSMKPMRILLILHKESLNKNYSQNKFAAAENEPNNSEK